MKNVLSVCAVSLLLLFGTSEASAERGTSEKIDLTDGWTRAAVVAGKERPADADLPKVGDKLEMEELKTDPNRKVLWENFDMRHEEIEPSENDENVIYLRRTFRWKTLNRTDSVLIFSMCGLRNGNEIWVNGTFSGCAADEYQEHDITPYLRENSENTILVRADLRRSKFDHEFYSPQMWVRSRFVWNDWVSSPVVIESAYHEASVRCRIDYCFGSPFEAETRVQAEFRIDDPSGRQAAHAVVPISRPEGEKHEVVCVLKVSNPIFCVASFNAPRNKTYRLTVTLFSEKDGVRTVYESCTKKFTFWAGETNGTPDKKREAFYGFFEPAEVEAIFRSTTDSKTLPEDGTGFPRPAELTIVTAAKEKGWAFLDVSVPVVCRDMGNCQYQILILDPDGTPVTIFDDFIWSSDDETVLKSCLRIPLPAAPADQTGQTPDPRPYRLRIILYSPSFCIEDEFGGEALYGEMLYDGLETTFVP